jgi:hypothetical protein
MELMRGLREIYVLRIILGVDRDASGLAHKPII